MTDWDVTRAGVRHRLAPTPEGLRLTGPTPQLIPWELVEEISYPTSFSVRILPIHAEPIDLGFPSVATQRAFRRSADSVAVSKVLVYGSGDVEGQTYEVIRPLLRQAIIRDIESHEVGGERLPFDRDVGRHWFHENEDEAIFAHLKATLENTLRELSREGSSKEKLSIHALSLRLDLLANMHGSDDPAAIFEEEFRLSPWYQLGKRVMDPGDEFSEREFADMNIHMLLQEACYMLELQGFLQPGDSSRKPGVGRAGTAFMGGSTAAHAPEARTPNPLESRLAEVEASYRRLRVIGLTVLVGIVALLTVAFTTARHWTKVDVPEHPETFRSETYENGKFVVSDNGVSPCTVGQSWNGCTNEMVDEYNNACTSRDSGRYSSSELWKYTELVPASLRICGAYAAEIDRMKQQHWAYTVTLGSYGHLTRKPQIGSHKVSNKDYRRAETHEAVCYLGFVGECE